MKDVYQMKDVFHEANDEFITIQASTEAAKRRQANFARERDRLVLPIETVDGFTIDYSTVGGIQVHHEDENVLKRLAEAGEVSLITRGTGSDMAAGIAPYTWVQYELGYSLKDVQRFLKKHPLQEKSIAHCPSETESLYAAEMSKARDEAHLAGEAVSRDPSKGAQPLCPVCYHNHMPIHLGGCHLD